jgi:hypothetical protein
VNKQEHADSGSANASKSAEQNELPSKPGT